MEATTDQPLTEANTPPTPTLPPDAPNDNAPADADLLRSLHAWHVSPTSDTTDHPAADTLPAALHAFRKPDDSDCPHPLLVSPESGDSGELPCLPLADWLKSRINAFAPEEGDARILKDNLVRLEQLVRVAAETPGRNAAATLLAAGQELETELGLNGADALQLHEGLARLQADCPKDGLLLPLREDTPVRLLVLALSHAARARQIALTQRVSRLAGQLRELIRVDDSKTPGKRQTGFDPAGMQGGRFNADALDKLLGPARGAVTMPPEKRKRLEQVLEILDHHLSAAPRAQATVVRSPDSPALTIPGAAEVEAGSDALCEKAIEIFDSQAADHARLFGAMRVGSLEAEGSYIPERHDALLGTFEWKSFDEGELLALPPVVAHESAEKLAGAGMAPLSRLMQSGRPIHTFVSVRPAAAPDGSDSATDPGGVRFEIGYLGVSHRETTVNQSSAARPEHFLLGVKQSLAGGRPALHVVASASQTDGGPSPLGSPVHSNAAVASRAHPLFHFNPEGGATWARRFDLDANPAPNAAWPVVELDCLDAAGAAKTLSLPFTFADFCLLEEGLRGHFRVLPAVADAHFTPLPEVLDLPPEEAAERLPFIWGIASDGAMRRLLVSRPLLQACRDRRNFWRTLQELGGADNEHVTAAVQRERDQLQAKHAAELEQLAQKAAADIEAARKDSVRGAMARLSELLLNGTPETLRATALSLANSTPIETTASEPTPETASEEVAPDAGEAAEEEAAPEPAAAYIDSHLCTSCNDCINLNSRLFVYNADKQATIGDISAGTFAQLVKAAQKCPSRCIHPGKPHNPDEPNLEKLVAQAKPYQ